MPYYQGDFYMGDYYMGDPGFFGFLGRLGRGILGLGGGKREVVREIAAPAAAGVATATGGLARRMEIARAMGRQAVGIVKGHPIISAAAAAGVTGAVAERMGLGRRVSTSGITERRGFHVSKMGKLVRNRRMRVTNPKALRRAIRRCRGFSHLAMRVLSFTHPRRVKGRPYFKAKRHRRAA